MFQFLSFSYAFLCLSCDGLLSCKMHFCSQFPNAFWTNADPKKLKETKNLQMKWKLCCRFSFVCCSFAHLANRIGACVRESINRQISTTLNCVTYNILSLSFYVTSLSRPFQSNWTNSQLYSPLIAILCYVLCWRNVYRYLVSSIHTHTRARLRQRIAHTSISFKTRIYCTNTPINTRCVWTLCECANYQFAYACIQLIVYRTKNSHAFCPHKT